MLDQTNIKYCRYSTPSGPQYGLVETVAGTAHITHLLPVAQRGLPDLAQLRKIPAVALESARLLAPVEPSKIVCVGRNYADHAKEMGNEVTREPLLFFKPPSALSGHGDKIVLPGISQRVEFEGELGVIIGKPCSKLKDSDDVRPFIFGYTCSDEVTARDLQRKDNQWARAKGFDTFCPAGPVAATDGVDPWKGVLLETRVNGTVRQSASTTLFIFPVDFVIRYISRIMTLVPGDLILTGTPAGVGPLAPGDEVAVSIEGIGTLKNPVVGAS